MPKLGTRGILTGRSANAARSSGEVVVQSVIPSIPTLHAEKWQPSPDWQPATYKVLVSYESGREELVKVEAITYGGMGVNDSQSGDRIGWHNVTVLSIGLCAMWFKTRLEAQHVAEILWDSCYNVFKKTTRAEILEACPPWVVKWWNKMKSAQCYLDPTPFQDGGSE